MNRFYSLLSSEDLDPDSEAAVWIRAAFRTLYDSDRDHAVASFAEKYGIAPPKEGNA